MFKLLKEFGIKFIFILTMMEFSTTFGSPLLETDCYPVESEGFTCCDSVDFMKNEYGNCLRSDTKYLKVTETIRGNDTCFTYQYYKYFDIELTKSASGYIDDYVMTCTDIKLDTFMPKHRCNLVIDKINSVLKLESNGKMVALIKTDIVTDLVYFEGFRTIPLDNTCNDIEVYCGNIHKNIKFCHKTHLECKNLLSNYYFPEKLSEFICPNLSLILFLLVLLLVFKVSSILIRTHLYLILFPAYYPICLLVYFLYEKLTKKCHNCGKPVHPFYSCNLTCTCGAIFNNTTTLKRHRQTQRCTYATLPLVKSCLLNGVFQFLNNITLVIVLFLIFLPSIHAIETHQFKTEQYKWEHKIKEYLNHFSNGLERDGFHKVAGALKNYKNDKSIILDKTQDTVTIDIPAQTYETTKITLYFEDKPILQMGLTIEESSIESGYELLYSTGESKHFKVEHDEICTGTCPTVSLKKGWVPFQKEATSYWGCEELGCLAAGDGCVWGSCDDIIDSRTLGKVFKKASNFDETILNICVYMLNDGYCKQFKENTLVHNGFRMQLINNDVSFLPTRVYMDKRRDVFVGELNDIGEYDAKCGQLQIINGTNFGKGLVNFDIICHTIGKKDVKVRQCRETSHHSCSQLEKIDKIGAVKIYKDNFLRLKQSIKDGYIKVQFDVLPFIRIADTISNEDLKLETTGSCNGCVGCALGINCLIQITSNMNTMCNLESTSVLFSLNHIIIAKGTHSYNIITYLKQSTTATEMPKTIVLKLCNKIMSLSSVIKLDTNNMENAVDYDKTTIDQGDSICNTALCQIFSDIYGFFEGFSSLGRFVKTIITTLVIIFLFLIFLYVVFPIIKTVQNKIKHS